MTKEKRLPFDPVAEAARHWQERWPGTERMAAATAIMRAQQIVLARVDAALAEVGLTFARYEALVLLHFSRTGQLPLGKMGLRLQVHPTSVTNAIDRLEAEGLVRRIPSLTDRRTTLAGITPRGREVVERATELVAASGFGLGSLGAADLAALSRVLRRLRKDAGDF